jgi:tRNA threonylcarbamoyl adenosine modification protein YeaZ
MTCLILEASTSPASWVFTQQGKIIYSGNLSGTVAATLVPSLQTLLPNPPTPSQILIGVGPGSFSGIRSAIASAHGMADSWHCPVLPIRSTGAIAWHYPDTPLLGIFSDARRGDIFATFYSMGKLHTPTQVHPATSLPSLLTRCTLAVTPDALPGIEKKVSTHATDLASYLHTHGLEPNLPCEPIHLRPTMATK